MEKQDVIDYVMETPMNTNPRILGQMLDELGGSAPSEPVVIMFRGVDGPGRTPVYTCDTTFEETLALVEKGCVNAITIPVSENAVKTVYTVESFADNFIDFVSMPYKYSTGISVRQLTYTVDGTIEFDAFNLQEGGARET